MKKNPIEMLEVRELLDKLVENGYGDFVDKILSNETSVYTKKGKLNRSGACRILGINVKQLNTILAECKNLLINSED